MDREMFGAIEGYMLSCMTDAAHDREHIYRVLYAALEITETEEGVDADVLTAACLLHDIGREAQFRDPSLCHAEVGSRMACDFLLGLGWDRARAGWVRDCVLTHRYRTDRRPRTLEAKILFDADKLDVTGAMGVAPLRRGLSGAKRRTGGPVTTDMGVRRNPPRWRSGRVWEAAPHRLDNTPRETPPHW